MSNPPPVKKYRRDHKDSDSEHENDEDNSKYVPYVPLKRKSINFLNF